MAIGQFISPVPAGRLVHRSMINRALMATGHPSAAAAFGRPSVGPQPDTTKPPGIGSRIGKALAPKTWGDIAASKREPGAVAGGVLGYAEGESEQPSLAGAVAAQKRRLSEAEGGQKTTYGGGGAAIAIGHAHSGGAHPAGEGYAGNEYQSTNFAPKPHYGLIHRALNKAGMPKLADKLGGGPEFYSESQMGEAEAPSPVTLHDRMAACYQSRMAKPEDAQEAHDEFAGKEPSLAGAAHEQLCRLGCKSNYSSVASFITPAANRTAAAPGGEYAERPHRSVLNRALTGAHLPGVAAEVAPRRYPGQQQGGYPSSHLGT